MSAPSSGLPLVSLYLGLVGCDSGACGASCQCGSPWHRHSRCAWVGDWCSSALARCGKTNIKCDGEYVRWGETDRVCFIVWTARGGACGCSFMLLSPDHLGRADHLRAWQYARGGGSRFVGVRYRTIRARRAHRRLPMGAPWLYKNPGENY